MGCDSNPNGSDFNIVTVVLQYGVIATLIVVAVGKTKEAVGEMCHGTLQLAELQEF